MKRKFYLKKSESQQQKGNVKDLVTQEKLLPSDSISSLQQLCFWDSFKCKESIVCLNTI